MEKPYGLFRRKRLCRSHGGDLRGNTVKDLPMKTRTSRIGRAAMRAVTVVQQIQSHYDFLREHRRLTLHAVPLVAG